MSKRVKVVFVGPDSQAKSLGIKTDDIIAFYNGDKIDSDKSLTDSIAKARKSNAERIEIIVLRDGGKISLNGSTEPLGLKSLEEKGEEKNDRVSKIAIVSTDSIAGYTTLKTLGMARGSTVRAKHIGKDFMADLKNLVGGEIKGYTELLAEGREEAIYRMKCDAAALGANAIVSVRFTTATLTAGAAEILAYGTPVVLKKKE